MINSFYKYATIFMMSFKQTWGNKTAICGTLFFFIILLALYNRLWEVIGIADNTQGLNSIYIWYLTFAEMIILSCPRTERTLFEDIQSGTFAYYTNKPVSFFLMRYSEALGKMSVVFMIMGIWGSITTLFLTDTPPFLWYQFPIVFLMCFISSCINVLFYATIGLCGLWLNSIRTLGMAFQRLAFILGGAIFPLSIYPDWFVDVAKWTPFYSVYYLTIKLVYDFSYANLLETFLLNTFWVTLFLLFISIAYSKLNKRVNTYGG